MAFVKVATKSRDLGATQHVLVSVAYSSECAVVFFPR